VVNQEGHVTMLDRSLSTSFSLILEDYRMVKKFVGNKGSVRDILTFTSEDQEFVMTASCDRHVRVFRVQSELQKEGEISHAYLKQKLNCLLIS